MGQLTLRLPESLRHQLETLARGKGVTVNQYVLSALSRQVKQAYTVEAVPEKDITKQRAAFADLLNSLGKASFSEMEKLMREREVVKPEKGLNPKVVTRLRNRIKSQSPRF